MNPATKQCQELVGTAMNTLARNPIAIIPEPKRVKGIPKLKRVKGIPELKRVKGDMKRIVSNVRNSTSPLACTESHSK